MYYLLAAKPTIVALLFALLFSFASDAAAYPMAAKQAVLPAALFAGGVKVAKGKVKAVDLDKGTISLSGTDKAAPDMLFSLASKDIKVNADVGPALKLADLKPGVLVTLGLNATGDVVSVQAKAPLHSGVITAVDHAKQTITVYLSTKVPDLTVAVGAQAKVNLFEQPLPAQELYPGLAVRLLLTVDSSAALEIHATLRRGAADPRGVVLQADPVKHTVQLLMPNYEGKVKLMTFPVAKDFRLVFNNRLKKIKLADVPGVKGVHELPKALPAWLLLDNDGKTVAAIVASSPVLNGVVKNVDAAAKTITVKSTAGLETYSVVQDADGVVKGKLLSLAELTAGAAVELHLGLNPTEVIAIRSAKAKAKIDNSDGQ